MFEQPIRVIIADDHPAEIGRVAWRQPIPLVKGVPESLEDSASDNHETTHGAEPAAGESIREY
jgi:hypothetical protein